MERTGVIIGLSAVGFGVLAYGGGWHWLIAIGLAPIILSFLPCAIMSGLGICLMGMSKTKSEPPTHFLDQNSFNKVGKDIARGNFLKSSPQSASYARKLFF
ncbi:hypothetical protein [Acidiphilium sp. 20-67-58]|uniref:hypothetical protein n=1 Tax=Acidiphilium sp. 20-67-58 TaxID=1970291 RepID=UPI0025C6BD65|nr:hypothetical protein [Acidiphilium sp. 20-67-58]HQT65659.1 hypothetical protein [Acidocella sp.]